MPGYKSYIVLTLLPIGKQSRADAWYHDLITMEYTFYDVSGAVMTLESVVQFIDGKFKKVARTTLNRTYFSLPVSTLYQYLVRIVDDVIFTEMYFCPICVVDACKDHRGAS